MKCPHFQKINFQKIKEVRNDQGAVDEQAHEGLTYSIFSIDSPSEQIYNIPEQGIDHVNSFKTKISNYKYSFSTLITREDSIKECSKIIMPKQMNVKKMISSSQRHISKPSISLLEQQNYAYSKQLIHIKQSENSQDGDIPCEHQHSQCKKNPHVLVSKTSMMAHDTFDIFNGVVFLDQKQDHPFQCQLKDNIIKISRQNKIKYFVQLQKVYVSLQDLKQNEKSIKMTLRCKNKNDFFKLYFINPFQKEIFREVYLNCVMKINKARKMRKMLQQDKENFGPVTNILHDEEQSEILDEKNQLNNEATESISSLSMSMNSYEGDSMVFQTERMFFEQVKETCNTFDILLFKNKSLMSKVQRIFTNSDYDHTALLLKTASNDLLMLEATSNSGVAIYTFNSLMKIDKSKYFSRIGLRKYNGDKNLIKISRLQSFIRKTVGKKYKFDPMYLIKSEANQQKQTYFCSQLVAQALQDAGILSNQSPSFKYLPKHFASQTLNSQIIDGKYSDTIILE